MAPLSTADTASDVDVQEQFGNGAPASGRAAPKAAGAAEQTRRSIDWAPSPRSRTGAAGASSDDAATTSRPQGPPRLRVVPPAEDAPDDELGDLRDGDLAIAEAGERALDAPSGAEPDDDGRDVTDVDLDDDDQDHDALADQPHDALADQDHDASGHGPDADQPYDEAAEHDVAQAAPVRRAAGQRTEAPDWADVLFGAAPSTPAPRRPPT